MKISIVNADLNPSSRCQAAADRLHVYLSELGANANLLSLAGTGLPLCDGKASFGHPSVQAITESIKGSQGYILLSPVFNYTLNSAAKSFIEHVGKNLRDKVVGLACTAGGNRSYMAPMQFLSSMMLDFRSLAIPKYVYLGPDARPEDGRYDDEVEQRLQELAETVYKVSHAIQ